MTYVDKDGREWPLFTRIDERGFYVRCVTPEMVERANKIMAAAPFKCRDDVIVQLRDPAGNKNGELQGMFEGYGPMKDECSILVPHEDGSGRKRRLWGVKWAEDVRLKPAAPVDSDPGVPQI